MDDTLHRLKDRLAEINDLVSAAAVLDWDQQTYMPLGGAAGRAEQLGTLAKLIHEKTTSDEMGQLLGAAQEQVQALAPDSDDVRLVRAAQREYTRRKQLPTPLVTEFTRTTVAAHTVWARARTEKDFKAFQPSLEKIFDLVRQIAHCFPVTESIYDPLLDDYEPGLKTSAVREVFAGLKRDLVPLVRAIAARPEVDDSLLHREYDEQKQWDFGLDIIRRFGYDFNRGRQDKAPHPFTTIFSLGDVRITTRVYANFLSSALMSTLHECGHALYDQGYPPSLARTPLANGASSGVHESQSRLWENLVGRSHGFWKFFYPRLQVTFPAQLQAVDQATFYRVINKVKPSLIRVEADEVTYNLHTMLRFELEVEVLEGRLAVKDLPAAWNAKVKDYLGLDVPDDSQGVLQDVHWSAGLVGYFPTYTLGNIASVQFFQQACQDMPRIPADMERGEFGALLTWLRDNIHRHGRKFTPTELMLRVTGQPLNAEPYVNYLKRKYTEIYGL